MGGIIEETRTMFDTFAERPFGPTDGLVLSQLAYARMPDGVPRHGDDGFAPLTALLRAESYDDMFRGVYAPERNVELVRAVCESPRWRGVRVGGCIDETDPDSMLQFAACTFDLGDGTMYVAFRGTDSSFVGWKEDFMMAFQRPVPSQSAAADYLRALGERWHGAIMVGGHSKGGNLAVYAAAEAPAAIQERIVGVHSYDGPGFDEEFRRSDGFARIRGRIHKTVPESSIVGLLFDGDATAGGYDVVRSDGVAVMQHFALNWRTERGRFTDAPGLSSTATYAAGVINDWMAKTDPEHRRIFVERLFGMLESTGHTTFAQLEADWKQSLPAMARAFGEFDEDDRRVVRTVLGAFASSAVRRPTT
ncbi:Mbeg1-like protein [Bifidobacterium samirii]|nr:Mbeg1-like protein [Bifidobacterium samirii]